MGKIKEFFLQARLVLALKKLVKVTKVKPMNRTQVLGVLRHVITIGAGILVARGTIDESTAQELGGGLLAVIGIIWSIFSPEKGEV